MTERFARPGEKRPVLPVTVTVTKPRTNSMQATERHNAAKRERRYREQAVAAWLRSLNR